MKTIEKASPSIESEGMTVTEMGVSAKRIHKILGHMRNTVYNDKRLAVVREYSSNSLDEHRKHKITQPVEIGIREGENGPEFFARDFALGLSDDGIRNVFAMSGESTKDDSDDDIGGFGIGAKCGLSYSDSFFVHSHFQGTKTIYSFVLGADDVGNEVGKVYDLDRSPTTETGIEVVVPIKQGEENYFWSRILKFVTFSPHNIRGSWNEQEVLPCKAKAEIQEGKFSVRSIPAYEDFSGKRVIQMGGIIYSVEPLNLPSVKILAGHALVFDMPIGTCEPALSRETFQDTRRTREAMVEINSICERLASSDLSQFKTKTVKDLVDDSLAQMTLYTGEFFQAYASKIYGDVWNFVKGVSFLDYRYGSPAETKNGKPICIVLPNNDARAYWDVKVRNYLSNSKTNAYLIKKGDWNETNKEITDHFTLICARKLPYPKVPRESGMFAVYRREYRKSKNIGKFDALGLFNHASKEHQWNFTATTEKEAFDFLTKLKDQVKTRDQLEKVSIVCSDSRQSTLFTVSSHVFADKLKSIGFILQGDDTWRAICKKITEQEEEKQRISAVVSSAKKEFVELGPKTSAWINKVRHAKRMSKFWETLLNERTLRGKLLTKLNERGYYNSSKQVLTRQEFKKILTLR